MKNLIIHPEYPTTTFLSTIYANLRNKTVVKGGITKSELVKLIESHDRIFMLGHGSPFGLFSRGQFSDAGLNIIDESMGPRLKNKSNCMYIWCFADKFVQSYGLSGLCLGCLSAKLEKRTIMVLTKLVGIWLTNRMRDSYR